MNENNQELKVTIDQAAIAEAVNQRLSTAVASALGSFEMQTIVNQLITTNTVKDVVQDALTSAIAQIDTADLTNTIAAELQRTTIRGLTMFMNEGVVDIICKLRGVGNYTDEDRASRTRVRAELVGNPK